MSETIRAARITKTGALIPLHEGNEAILKQQGVTEVEAKRDPDTGKLISAGGSEYVNLVSASANLPRIADALRDNHTQREKLLTAALQLPNGEEFLMEQDLYDGKSDRQYIDPKTLVVPEETIDVPDEAPPVEGIEDVSEQLAKSQSKKKRSSKKSDADLSDL